MDSRFCRDGARLRAPWVCVALAVPFTLHASTLEIEFRPVFGGRPLLLDSLQYRNSHDETFSVTRLSMLLSDFELQGEDGAGCFHCHSGILFTDHQFHNNGLPSGDDLGRAKVTEKESDRYTFATPSLRNVALTAPYMHDGRFQTLDEVIEHYTGPMKQTATLDPNLSKHPREGLQISEQDKAALVAFLKTLTDPQFSSGEDGKTRDRPAK